MKKSNSKSKALGAFKKLGAVALITATMFFTACNQTGGGGGKPKPTPTPTKYTVTLNQAEHGNVTASPAIPANKLVVKDTVITFTATANAGYKVGKWKVTPAEALQAGTGADGSSTAKVKITADTTVSVSFDEIPKHAITFSVEGANGTLTAKVDGGDITSGKEVEQGKTVTFTATANDGYRVKGWTLDGSAVNGTNNSYSFTVSKAVTVKVSFEDASTPLPKHKITFSVEGANGTLKAKADGIDETNTSPINVEEGKTVTFTAEPSTNYKVKEWKVGDTVVTGNKTNTYAHTVTKAVTVKVSFEDASTPLPKHKITFSVDGANGTLKAKADGIDETSTSPITVEEGKTVTFTAEPSTNYKVKEWKVGDTVVTGNKTTTYTHTVTKAVTVKVSFEAKSNPPNPPTPQTKYTVTLNQTEHGKVTASPEIPEDKKVLKDTEITFTAKADDGYKIGKWTVTGSVLETGTGADGSSTAKVKITANTSVSVSFEAIPPTKYTVTLTQTANGKVTASPEIPEDKKVAKDTEITFTATADDGYRVNTWLVSPRSAIQSGGGKGETTATLKITANTTVSVSFEAIPPTKHAITFNVEGANGTLKAIVSDKEINSGDKVEQGKTVTFTAKADIGYVVKKWTLDGNAVNGTEKTYTLTVTQACKVTVSFELGKAILTLVPNKLNIKVKAKTKDGSAIEVEGCNEPTLASDVETELHATGTTVTLKGYITELYCKGINKGYNFESQLTALDVQGLTALQGLWCENNKLTELNVSGLTTLQKLWCNNNQLTSLNVQGLTSLQVLHCGKNQLTELNVQGLTALQELGCYSNQLTELNVQGLTTLQKLWCENNKLTELNVSGLTALQWLKCNNNQLTSLNVQGLTALQGLWCENNKLTELNVSGLTALQELKCHGNQLTELNVQGLTALRVLWCDNNKLTRLDVSGLTVLQELGCSGNKLTRLDVSGLTVLQTLNCSQSQLTSLDVSDCIALRYLECFLNRLGSKALTKLLDALPDRVVGDRAEARLYCESGCFGSSEGNWKDFTKPKGLKAAFDDAKDRNWKLTKGVYGKGWIDI